MKVYISSWVEFRLCATGYSLDNSTLTVLRFLHKWNITYAETKTWCTLYLFQEMQKNDVCVYVTLEHVLQVN